MGAWSQRYMARIHERWTMELDTIGTEITEEVRESISKPVEYFGLKVVRSKPGQRPRKETGHLWASQAHAIIERGGPALQIRNDAEYAYTLDVIGVFSMQYGGAYFTRPFFHVATDRWHPKIGPRLIQSLEGL